MQDFETEDQQVEAIKKWWNENASSLLIGLGIGLFSLGGWSYYVESENDHRIEASDIFVEVDKQFKANQVTDEDIKKVDQLVSEYPDTPYAALSSLSLAAQQFNKGNVDKAIDRLNWVADNATEDEVRHIARLRLANVLLGQKKYDEARKLLAADHPEAFKARYEELKGDVFVAMGEVEQARVAYDKAIAGSGAGAASRWLKLKRQNLGSPELDKPATVEPSA